MIIAAICLLISCKKDAPTNSSIVGKWQWIKTTGGIAGITTTPQSTHQTWTFAFNADLTYTEAGTMFDEPLLGKYQVTVANNIPTLNLVTNNNVLAQYSYMAPIHDTLYLYEQYADGFTSTFVRK